MKHKRTCFPRTGINRNRWKPKYIAGYTRVPVNNDDPRERTRQLVQRVAEHMLRNLRDNEDSGYLDRLRKRCRQAALYDDYECQRDEVSLP